MFVGINNRYNDSINNYRRNRSNSASNLSTNGNGVTMDSSNVCDSVTLSVKSKDSLSIGDKLNVVDYDDIPYGPGIVAKLRSKFLQYSLQTTQQQTCPSNNSTNATYAWVKRCNRTPPVNNNNVSSIKPVANVKPIQIAASAVNLNNKSNSSSVKSCTKAPQPAPRKSIIKDRNEESNNNNNNHNNQSHNADVINKKNSSLSGSFTNNASIYENDSDLTTNLINNASNEALNKTLSGHSVITSSSNTSNTANNCNNNNSATVNSDSTSSIKSWPQVIKSTANIPTATSIVNKNIGGTTMIFDFRGKNVRANVAVQSPPFSIHRPSSLSSSNHNDDEDDYNYNGSMEVPQPCGIIFIGENVVVGRGSLLVNRNKRLTIQFNDNATETFEYPSESSMMEDNYTSQSCSPVPYQNCNKTPDLTVINSTSATTSLRNNTILGGSNSGSLASYKPAFLNTKEPGFELGISRLTKSEDKVRQSSSINANNDDTHEDEFSMIKPANPKETASWSSSTALDLLF